MTGGSTTGGAGSDLPGDLETAYKYYIESYTKLTEAATKYPIEAPETMREAYQGWKEIQDKLQKDPSDRRAYQANIAAYNRLTSLLAKEKVEAPTALREIQTRYFRAKANYEKLLSQRR